MPNRETDPLKPGIFTVEVQGAIVVIVVTVLIGVGIVTTTNREEMTGQITAAVTAVATIAGMVAMWWKAAHTREQVKVSENERRAAEAGAAAAVTAASRADEVQVNVGTQNPGT